MSPQSSAKNLSGDAGKQFAVVILAAGQGTRLKSKYPKVLHRIGGQALLQHVIATGRQIVPATRIFAIIGHEAEKVRTEVAATGVNFILQAEQRGTGHALLCAREAIAEFPQVLVLSGDVPLLRAETLRELMRFHLAQRAAMSIVTTEPEDPAGYGRIVRAGRGPHRVPGLGGMGQGKAGSRVAAIVEERALTPQQKKIREINSGIYAFRTSSLLEQLTKLRTDNYHHEFYLTDVAALLMKARQPVLAFPIADSEEVLGINTRAELARLDALFRRRKAAALMAAGVTIFRPETCMIDAAVEIGADTVIEPCVQLLGNTRIGEDCHIGSYSVIRDSNLGDAVEVRPGCMVTGSTVHDRAVLGPYAHLRPESEIGEDAHVGNFVETKKARLGRGSKANHLSYLGDSEIGDSVNVGAGTITCNYDGTHKHRTVIEEGAFIGSDATLVAPVRIGRGAYIGAGSCITEDVPADALGLGRALQTVKEGWAAKRRRSIATAQAASLAGGPEGKKK